MSPELKARIQAQIAKVAAERAKDVSNSIESVCLTKEQPCKPSNRHKPGYKKEYMRTYMRKRRAKTP